MHFISPPPTTAYTTPKAAASIGNDTRRHSSLRQSPRWRRRRPNRLSNSPPVVLLATIPPVGADNSQIDCQTPRRHCDNHPAGAEERYPPPLRVAIEQLRPPP
ncbi:chloroplast import apparatus 2 [Striga asiatica]|uniref:Chloroplast import apparatus 2 n=1 Tax=Striga asiatica TaxID=4170 RepID=A0A5A7P0N3_STRAF|nr:chloroplast import apparatus 2 [Striga asiatica]